MSCVDTTELLKQAMAAVKEAGVPEPLQAVALQLAVEDLRGGDGQSRAQRPRRGSGAGGGSAPAKQSSRASTKRAPSKRSGSDVSVESILSNLPDESSLFKAIEKETSVPVGDLQDVFHIEDGHLNLKVASKELGTNKKASTQTVTALLGGVVFAGTDKRQLPFSEINAYCTAKHCFDSANSASYIKATPGFSSVGSRRTQELVTRTGWQNEFAKATRRVLGKAEAAN